MGTHMKTTVEIADAILERAKALAHKESTTLRALIEEGLEAVLKRRRGQPGYKLPDRSVDGQGVDPAFADAGWSAIRDAAYDGRGA